MRMTNYGFKLSKFFYHKLMSINQHSAHSPFLFDLFKNVIHVPFDKSYKDDFKSYYNPLTHDKYAIRFEEHGAGNNQDKVLTISTITKRSAMRVDDAKFLIYLCKFLNPSIILELGTSTGVGAYALKIGAPNSNITTVEGCSELAKYIKSKYGLSNIEYIHSTFDHYFDAIIDKNTQFDLVYVDGNHTYDATLHYYEILKNKHSHSNTCLIFDDIYWSKQMFQAWKEIVKDSKNTLTLDLFNMGVVFFNPKLSKQHFRISI